MKKNTFIIFDKIFRDPVDLIVCRDPAGVDQALTCVDRAVSSGHYAAGFLSYELGYCFQEIPSLRRVDFPLLVFGIFDRAEPYQAGQVQGAGDDSAFTATGTRYSVSRENYLRDIARIKDHLVKGNTYQVNYTFKYKFDLEGSPYAFYKSLTARQNGDYSAFIDLPRWTILSLSPELFFKRDGKKITVRPMKGTIARGATPEEDRENVLKLASSIKNRAENIMIVDLLRNDLGRISETGSVAPEALFEVEEYPTLFQMTSTISADIKDGVTWKEIFRSIFPSGSVTGAPKKRTMEIIRDAEKENRNIYTGSIGYITPGGEACFNVAIRTALINKDKGAAEMGIGSGIVYDSNAECEYAECVLKGAFLTALTDPSHSLIETILWEDGDYFLLNLHLSRLEKSAAHFSYAFDRAKVIKALYNTSMAFDSSGKYRVRLLLDKKGSLAVTSHALKDTPHPVKVAISEKQTDKNDVYFFHKTTNRSFYDRELSLYQDEGYFDVLFFNTDGELTEGAITNVLIKKGGEFFTPPVSCGLLDGVYRRHLLETREIPLKEKVLTMEDLENADEIFVINSVRKMVPATLRVPVYP